MATAYNFDDDDSLDADLNAFHSNTKEQMQGAKSSNFSSNNANHQNATLSDEVLMAALKRYFGHSSFRPHQGQIVQVSC